MVNSINNSIPAPQVTSQRISSDKDKDDALKNGAVAPQSGTYDKDYDGTGVKRTVAVQKQENPSVQSGQSGQASVKQTIDKLV